MRIGTLCERKVAADATQLFYYGVEKYSHVMLQMNALGCTISTADLQEIFLKEIFLYAACFPTGFGNVSDFFGHLPRHQAPTADVAASQIA